MIKRFVIVLMVISVLLCSCKKRNTTPKKTDTDDIKTEETLSESGEDGLADDTSGERSITDNENNDNPDEQSDLTDQNGKTDENKITAAPERTGETEITEGPERAEEPEITEEPVSKLSETQTTEKPEITAAPERTEEAEITETPDNVEELEITEVPEQMEESGSSVEPVFSEADRRRAEKAIMYVGDEGGLGYDWHIGELFGYDENIENVYIDYWCYKAVKGNPSIDEVREKVFSNAQKYCTDSYIEKLLPYFNECLVDIGGVRFCKVDYSDGFIGWQTFRYYTENGEYLAQGYFLDCGPYPDDLFYFRRVDGTILLDKIEQCGKFVNDRFVNAFSGLNDHITDVTATSKLVERTVTHSPDRIIDQNYENAWCEGASGVGIGESVTIKLDYMYKVTGLEIWNGYQKDSDRYYKNARPSRIEIVTSSGTSQIFNLNDDYQGQGTGQILYFDEPVYTDTLTIIIKDVYKGTQYEDTLISEVFLF